LIHS
jgi:hypothetical protein